jgi:hypothetical protein
MIGTYIVKSGSEYTLIHDFILEVVAYHYGKDYPHQILRYMSSNTPDLTTWSILTCSDKNSSLNFEYGFLFNISMKTFINCGCLKALFRENIHM